MGEWTALTGVSLENTQDINQENAPEDFWADGVWWHKLGTYTITGGSVTVKLSDDANEYVIADAALIVPNNPNVQIIDDGDSGFYSSEFTSFDGEGYGGDVMFAEPSEASGAYASWTLSGLQSGTYLVFITWTPHENRATDASFGVNDDEGYIDQQEAPDDLYDLGTFWELLGEYVAESGTIEVSLFDVYLANGYVVADAVRIERLA